MSTEARTAHALLALATLLTSACGARSDLIRPDVATPADATVDAPRGSCASFGGRCITQDLPCDLRSRPLADPNACSESNRCCVPRPPPAIGRCIDASDCLVGYFSGRTSGGICDSEVCVCAVDGVEVLTGLCGPRPMAGEQYLCTTNGTAPAGSGRCGDEECPAMSTCGRGGERLFCTPARPASPARRDYCQLTNCGVLRCEPPLRCLDTATSQCGI